MVLLTGQVTAWWQQRQAQVRVLLQQVLTKQQLQWLDNQQTAVVQTIHQHLIRKAAQQRQQQTTQPWQQQGVMLMLLAVQQEQ